MVESFYHTAFTWACLRSIKSKFVNMISFGVKEDKFVYLQDLRVRWAYLLLAAFVNVVWLLTEIYHEQPFDFLVMRAFITISFCTSYLFLRTDGTQTYYQRTILINGIFHQGCYFFLFAWSGSTLYMGAVFLAMVLAPIAFEMTWRNSTILNIAGLIGLNIIAWPSEVIEPFDLASVNILYIGGTIYTLSSRGLFIQTAIENNEFQAQLQSEKDKMDEKNKELHESNRIKTKFLSILSHDIRGPLNNIRSMLHLSSSQDKLTAVERRCLEFHILESIDSTVELLDKILEWSQYQVTGGSVQRANLNVSRVVKKVFDLYSHSAESKKIKLIDTTPAQLEIVTDPSIFNLVLRNLVGNAIKFTNQGSVSVDCVVLENTIEVTVSDTGIGVFNGERISTRAETTSTFGTADEKGFGFGLMLCKQFLAKIGGTIGYRPNPAGIGSVFLFSIPRLKPLNEMLGTTQLKISSESDSDTADLSFAKTLRAV
jgi:signal transduction histidine kinase